MQRYNISLIGFGGVNRALAEIIAEQPERLSSLGIELRVVAISDLALGTLLSASGIDLHAALALPRGSSFAELGGSAEARNEEAITFSATDIVVEATFTDAITGEPATSHVRWALEAGKHVSTTNKGPVALHADELRDLAAANGVSFQYEGAVMSGTPVLRFAAEQLAGLTVERVEGIFNGTSNFVLGRMQTGATLDEAVLEAQARGYAEADPSADIAGSDVRLKVAIVARDVFGAALPAHDIPTRGITDITSADIHAAREAGRVWKLIGSIERTSSGTVSATIEPRALPGDHPLAAISGATNAITYTTDLLGHVTVIGPGAGRHETAFALLSDINAIHTSRAGAVRA